MIELSWGAATDVGRVRDHNEDAWFAGRRIFAVADGLGGHRAGEVAAGMVVDELATLDGSADARIPDDLVEAVAEANRAITSRSRNDPATSGMGTTVTALAIDGGVAHLAHVGDSRCYMLRDGRLTMISSDHTLVQRMIDEGTLTPEQAESHPQRSIVTRALGAEQAVDVDHVAVPLKDGDRFLLCSDGLSGVVSDDAIAQAALDGADPQTLSEMLVAEANRRGGPDNITVVVLDVSGDPPVPAATAQDDVPARMPVARPARAPRRRAPRRAIAWTVAVLVLVAGGLFGMKAWANRSWYVGLTNDGTVAIFRGLPTDFVVSLNEVHTRTDIDESEVAPFFVSRLREGIRADSLDDARERVARIPRAAATPTPSPTPDATTSPSPAGSPT